jgi:hypothetical protein
MYTYPPKIIFLGASKRLYNSLRWLIGWLVRPSIGPHDEILESAYIKIWLRRNCFALVPGLDYLCFSKKATRNFFLSFYLVP